MGCTDGSEEAAAVIGPLRPGPPSGGPLWGECQPVLPVTPPFVTMGPDAGKQSGAWKKTLSGQSPRQLRTHLMKRAGEIGVQHESTAGHPHCPGWSGWCVRPPRTVPAPRRWAAACSSSSGWSTKDGVGRAGTLARPRQACPCGSFPSSYTCPRRCQYSCRSPRCSGSPACTRTGWCCWRDGRGRWSASHIAPFRPGPPCPCRCRYSRRSPGCPCSPACARTGGCCWRGGRGRWRAGHIAPSRPGPTLQRLVRSPGCGGGPRAWQGPQPPAKPHPPRSGVCGEGPRDSRDRGNQCQTG